MVNSNHSISCVQFRQSPTKNLVGQELQLYRFAQVRIAQKINESTHKFR